MKIHKGNALRLGGFGILITGPSNAGKSVLTLALIERSLHVGRTAVLVGDDYIELEKAQGQLFAHTPRQIAGAMEIRGAGLFKVDFENKTRLDLVVELGKAGERYPEEHAFKAFGVQLPLLKLPQVGTTDVLALCHAIEATLFRTRWQPEFAEKSN